MGLHLRFTLKQLQVFVAVAQQNNVGKAAQKLALSQSAVSMSLSQLESALGQSVFERHGKRLQLNHWGVWLRPRAQRILSEAQHLELGFAGQQLISGEMPIGVSQTIAECLLPDVIGRLDQQYPQLRVEVSVSNSELVVDGLLEHRFALGIIEGNCFDSRLEQALWCDDELVIVAGKQHALAQVENVKMAQLAKARWVLRESGSGTREIFQSAVNGRIKNLKVWREYSHVPTLIKLVEQGSYLSCLPKRSVEQTLESGQLVQLQGHELEMLRRFSFVWLKSSGNSPLRDCVIQTARELIH
ncbi:LysR family transcriptional regulator [Alginatibacterium sediminis]|uniref:LysR family transcriptional regulator n=1 Tax=Alginatibacterium sediminis TaxID=2164068 RepID=A0A420E657_9ALTE|nr:LysR substrate-binding domain-containing protein [Alginatibacterium sediminis]RKF13283.1 LysR family transcriptional regulator [Alginatibacterium sediminis]